MKLIKKAVRISIKALPSVIAVFLASYVLLVISLGSFGVGYFYGAESVSLSENNLSRVVGSSLVLQPSPTPQKIYIEKTKEVPVYPKSNYSWTGPELWEAVNNRRQELGINPLGNRSELCTITSIRLNELLDLGGLDGHEGFSNLADRREDLKWIFDKYNISEFLVQGATSAQEAVSLWENTLGHRKLLDGGEYVWGCVYAQEGIGVAIAAY